ncbi:hypothetical protein [Synechococcus sp. PCC 7502]|uniref:hypothetical protein n=1 Tax=Synechococcus sp. PCC 7502 TaxID=1173263 RepID=UPI000685AED8|nr:hypothetical protein [Synechococcus sp. PCC 7502]
MRKSYIREATRKPEEEEKQKSLNPSETDKLNAFSFLSIVQEKFPHYNFQPYKVDGFVTEVLTFEENLTPSKFKQEIIEKGFDLVDKYKAYISDGIRHPFNPYTEIRHLCYLSDKSKYQRILYNDQRSTFDNWLHENA